MERTPIHLSVGDVDIEIELVIKIDAPEGSDVTVEVGAVTIEQTDSDVGPGGSLPR